MTRESKIGLLVGLAFIIVLGILISNNMSITNEPLGAPLRVAGENLRSGLGQPNPDDVAPVLRVPQAITPQQPVVINQELKHHITPQPTEPTPPVRFVDPTPNSNTSDRIRHAAQQQGEEVVPVEPKTVVDTNPVAAPTDPQPVQPPVTKSSVARSYQAQPGDSLGSIAHKAYGSGSRANCALIIAANPSLQDDPDLIVAGRTYKIPAADGTDSAQTTSPDVDDTAVAKNVTYTVKPHDTLTSIAMLEVGSRTAIITIRELNKDILNGSDRLRPNMKLKLPAKTAE